MQGKPKPSLMMGLVKAPADFFNEPHPSDVVIVIDIIVIVIESAFLFLIT